MSSPATAANLQEFNRDGYVMVRGLFSKEESTDLLAFARADQSLAEEAYVRKDSQGGDTKLALRNDLDDRSPYAAVARARRIVEPMQMFLGDEVYHYHHKMMLKQPKTGGAWEWHQDYGYWYNNGCLFPDMASCLIAVDTASRENGCLQVLKGSQRLGRIDHGKAGGQIGADMQRVEAAIDRFELVYCEMDPGDALFFHGNVLHRSDQNRSEKSRWSLICCYNTKHNDPIVHDGRHPNYSPLEIWEDRKVQEALQQAAAAV